MRKTIFLELVVIAFSLFDSSRVNAQLVAPLPQGTTYVKGMLVSQSGVGVMGCSNVQYLLADGSGCNNPLSPTGVVAGTYHLATFTVNASGLISSASNGSAVQGPGTTNRLPKWNGDPFTIQGDSSISDDGTSVNMTLPTRMLGTAINFYDAANTVNGGSLGYSVTSTTAFATLNFNFLSGSVGLLDTWFNIRFGGAQNKWYFGADGTNSYIQTGSGHDMLFGPACGGAVTGCGTGFGVALRLSATNYTATFIAPVIIGVTKFTTSGCSVSSTTGNGTAGIFTLGANSCTVVLTMGGGSPITAPAGWACSAHDRTAPTVQIGGETSSTTTAASIVIPAGAGATDVIAFSCRAF